MKLPAWSFPLALLVCLLPALAAAQQMPQPYVPPVYFSIERPVYLQPGPVPLANSILPSKVLNPGDVLGANGNVLFTNAQLLSAFKPSPLPVDARGTAAPAAAPSILPPNYGLDSLVLTTSSWMPGALFSTERSFYSATHGKVISDGDLLSRDGKIVAAQRDLLANFGPMPIVGNMGLDAAHLQSLRYDAAGNILPAEIWFSTSRGWFDEKLGRKISPGDVLSSYGRVVATNADLLKRFAPVPLNSGKYAADAANAWDFGLDALYVNDKALLDTTDPLGREFWFSTERGFYSRTLNRWISDGDLVSSYGRVVASNKDLLYAFGPHWPADAGLDAAAVLWNPVITAVPEPATCLLLGLAAAGVLRRRKA